MALSQFLVTRESKFSIRRIIKLLRMTLKVPDQSNHLTPRPKARPGSGEHLDLLADYLETLRETTDLRPGLTVETKLELAECLALAEAALRRAHLEERF